MNTSPKVVGIGGIFLKSENPTALYNWYREVLGIESESWGAQFSLSQNKTKDAYTAWCVFDKDTKYLDPSTSPFMINYVVNSVDDFEQLLNDKGINILGREDSEFGKFMWLLDLDGNKIELWEPAS